MLNIFFYWFEFTSHVSLLTNSFPFNPQTASCLAATTNNLFIPQISNSEIFPAYSSFKIFLPRFQLIR